MDSDQQLNFHVSIRKGSAISPLQKCNTCCSLGKFHCPFCPPEIFRPTKRSSLKIHLDKHRRKAFNWGEYTFHRCRLWCRSQAHYHCLYCKATVIRKRAFHNHLSFCRVQQQRRAQKLSRLQADLTRRTPEQSDTPLYHVETDDDSNEDSEDQNSQEASSSQSGVHSFPSSNKCDTVRKMKRSTETDSSKCHKAVQTDALKPQDCDEYHFMTLAKLFKKLAPQKKAEVRIKIERLLFEAEFT